MLPFRPFGYRKIPLSVRDFLEMCIRDSIITSDNTPVGVISFSDRGKGHYYLNCLCVIPAYQGKGIGTQAFQYMLSLYPDWEQITLVTPADKKQNIKFYTEKCGFHVADKEMHGNVEIVNFYRKNH